MTDGRSAGRAAGEGAAGRELALLHDASARIGSALDLGTTAQEIVDVAVPRFADAAGVFALEHLIADDEVAARSDGGSIEVRRLAVGVTGAEPPGWAAASQVDEVTVYPPHTEYARCLANGSPVRFNASTSTSLLAVPLRARGRALGFVVFGRGDRTFTGQDVKLAEELAARAAVCIDNARLYRRERRTAIALREALLPRHLTVPPGVEIAHRSLPVGETAALGGDWYDAVPLSGGRVTVIVGDAMGHGSVAAAAMVQLRTALRTLASLNLPPADALYRLDRLAQDLAAAQFATCVYVTCDPAAGSCVIAGAGHVPPIVVYPDGTTGVLQLAPGLPLGVGGAPFEATEYEIPAGGTLALYTDGLVERRGRDLDAGIAELREVLSAVWASGPATLDAACAAASDALTGDRELDDVTLLLVRLRASSGT